MSRIAPRFESNWFERKFKFNFPLEHFPNLCARLAGTPARLLDLIQGTAPEVLTAKPDGKWSIQEQIGHLLDMEPLWLARVEDFLQPGRTLTPADLSNSKTHAANHNTRLPQDLIREFRSARTCLLARVESLPPNGIGQTLLHPRLQQPMRLIDHLSFVADHDDHHIARIQELLSSTPS